MPLSIVVPLPPDLPLHRDGRSPPDIPEDISDNSGSPSQESESLSGWPSSHSHGTDSPGTSPVSTFSQEQVPVPSRKMSSSSLPIFSRPPLGNPPIVHWSPSSASLSSSSSTLVDSPRKENGNANDAVDSELRTHLQTCLDENKLANRSLTMDNAASHCAALKGFQHHSTVQFGSSFQQLLTHATMLDFAIEDSNHGGLSQILHGLDRGVDDFLESLERLPFDLRNTQSFISGTSDILQAKSALLAVARQLTSQTDGNASHQTVKRCQQERDILLRAIRVFFEIADLESRLQDKLTVKLNRGPETSPKRRFRFRLPRRQSTGAQRAKLPDTPTVSNPGHYELGDDAANVDEDEYSFHVAMVSDILSPPNLDEYWGVSMPGPVRDAADIVLSDEGDFIQGASLAALVYILTDPQPINIPNSHDELLDTFLLCFRSFCDPVDLAKALISRLEEQPLNLNSSQREAWPLYRSSVRSLVWKFIKTWIDEYWMHEKDRIAGLHIKDFASQSPEQIEPDEKDKIVRILDERREVAISLAPIGDTADKSQSEPMVTSERRIACRQKPIRYKRGLQERADKLVRRVPQYTPSDDDFRSARALDDLIRAADGGLHILHLNSRELCQELARQLAIFMSEGYRRVIPEDLWYRHGLGYDCNADIARSAQQAYERALSSWVTGSILHQEEPVSRAAVMTFFIALGLRSHEEHNFSGMFGIYHGLAHLSLQSLSEARLPLSEPAHLALERLGELKDEVESVVVDWRQVAVFPRPAVPPMAWYFNALGVAINAKPMVKSPHSRAQMANMERCIKITRIIREMEQWHVPYNYPRADNAQAWLLKSLEGAIARDVDREGNWMLKQSESIELSGRPESTNKKLLPRISVPFGKKNLKMELREATMFDLIPELEARN